MVTFPLSFREPPAAQRLRRALRACLDDDDWVVVGRIGAARLNRALARDVQPGHVLHGKTMTAIARALGADDVLYAGADGALALVHLSYDPNPISPDWPSTGFYDSVEDFTQSLAQERCYQAAFERAFALGAEHPEGSLLCPQCGADWGDAEAGGDCPVCGGWALARPCPVCDGACGAVWTRAITDSVDAGEPIWIGSCALKS